MLSNERITTFHSSCLHSIITLKEIRCEKKSSSHDLSYVLFQPFLGSELPKLVFNYLITCLFSASAAWSKYNFLCFVFFCSFDTILITVTALLNLSRACDLSSDVTLVVASGFTLGLLPIEPELIVSFAA